MKLLAFRAEFEGGTMRKCLALTFFAMVSVPLGGLKAAPASTPSAAYAKCLDAAQAIDPRMLECGGAELERQDKTLNLVYAELMKHTDADSKDALRKAQRAWIAFRDAEAVYLYGGANNGSLDRITSLNREIDMTIARTAELREYIKRTP